MEVVKGTSTEHTITCCWRASRKAGAFPHVLSEDTPELTEADRSVGEVGQGERRWTGGRVGQK